mmetsp:Transcript_39840/g.97914  ORF Transcript_39840/g.97914 Transcript_39840/m.97914 type:complete len:214 (-) Transcript_39840:286-927(-)
MWAAGNAGVSTPGSSGASCAGSSTASTTPSCTTARVTTPTPWHSPPKSWSSAGPAGPSGGRRGPARSGGHARSCSCRRRQPRGRIWPRRRRGAAQGCRWGRCRNDMSHAASKHFSDFSRQVGHQRWCACAAKRVREGGASLRIRGRRLARSRRVCARECAWAAPYSQDERATLARFSVCVCVCVCAWAHGGVPLGTRGRRPRARGRLLVWIPF